MTACTVLTKFLAQITGSRVNNQCQDTFDILPWLAVTNKIEDESLELGKSNDAQIFGNILADWPK